LLLNNIADNISMLGLSSC